MGAGVLRAYNLIGPRISCVATYHRCEVRYSPHDSTLTAETLDELWRLPYTNESQLQSAFRSFLKHHHPLVREFTFYLLPCTHHPL